MVPWFLFLTLIARICLFLLYKNRQKKKQHAQEIKSHEEQLKIKRSELQEKEAENRYPKEKLLKIYFSN